MPALAHHSDEIEASPQSMLMSWGSMAWCRVDMHAIAAHLLAILVLDLLRSHQRHEARLCVAAAHVRADGHPLLAEHGLVQGDEGRRGSRHGALVRVHEVGLPPGVPGLQAAPRFEPQQRQPCTADTSFQ